MNELNTRRQFTREFKLESVEYLLRGDKTALKWTENINLERVSLSELSGNLNSAIRLKVSLKCEASKKSNITISLNSIVPHISYYYDDYSVYLDNKMHTYYFKLPLHFLGAFRIWVTDASEVVFDNVEIYFNKKNQSNFPVLICLLMRMEPLDLLYC